MYVPWVPWDTAAGASGALAVVGGIGPRWRRRWVTVAGAWARELALVLGLYSLWRLAGQLSVLETTGALTRGRWIWDAERTAHLPDERSVQHLVLGHPLLVQVLNGFYAIVHVPALIVFLVWLFARHRDRYPAVRNTLALMTLGCFLVQLVPVAPPRLLPGLGVVDTGLKFGPTVYTASGANTFDQLAAMPSVHVAWALLVGIAVVLVSRSRWRWFFLLHPVLTVFVVVATGNHYWADGIVAGALLALGWALQRGARAVAARVRLSVANRAAVRAT